MTPKTTTQVSIDINLNQKLTTQIFRFTTQFYGIICNLIKGYVEDYMTGNKEQGNQVNSDDALCYSLSMKNEM